MTAREAIRLGGCPARGSEAERPVEREPFAAVEQHGEQLSVRRERDVAKRPDVLAALRDRPAAQGAEQERTGAVEVKLVLLEQDEWRVDCQLVGADGSRRQRQEAVDVV